jgi:hypothetical protein
MNSKKQLPGRSLKLNLGVNKNEENPVRQREVYYKAKDGDPQPTNYTIPELEDELPVDTY